jgi:uncharacterized protein
LSARNARWAIETAGTKIIWITAGIGSSVVRKSIINEKRNLMAQKSGKGNGSKGFGSMDEARQREISSQGGKASAQSNTSNRGFASMDKNKQREISSLGGKASQSAGRNQRGSTGRNEQAPSKDSDRKYQDSVTSGADMDQKNLSSLDEEDEVVGSLRQASYSETDEDEDEGVGDGNIGRSKNSIGSDEEG